MAPTQTNTSHMRTALPTNAQASPRSACGAACGRDRQRTVRLPPPETEPALGATMARSTLKKELPTTGVQRGLESPDPSPELCSQHTKAQGVPRHAQSHTGLAPGSPQNYTSLPWLVWISG